MSDRLDILFGSKPYKPEYAESNDGFYRDRKFTAWNKDGLTQIIGDKAGELEGSDHRKEFARWMRGNIRCDRCKHSIITGSGRLACFNPVHMQRDAPTVPHDHYCKEFSR